ncbi:unnamed protein product [Arctia plantaginis]|uniref:Wiskott-Aldrich syndrome protein family member n=1 Tax=Arctia plantaginis TaxID=874455 RepID=A0A8S1B1G8_ARCPL|nr:unnamed protein product [Arctia plantaginis]
MPLPKRCVEPVHVSRGTVPERLAVPSELEAVTNGTLANTVRQLSSLSKHAEDMFGELTREATNLAERTNVLQARIDRLAIKVTQLDSGVEEVSLQDIQMRKAFRSARTFQQQLFSRNSMPSAMLSTYARCDRPPPLEMLNEFRDDGRDARKFYTDPDYFFELWRREMLQDTERIQHDRGKKVRPPRSGSGAEGRNTRRVRPPHSTRDRLKEAAVTRGEHIMAPSQLRHYNVDLQQYKTDPVYQITNVSDGGYRASQTRTPATQQARPNSIEIENQQNRQPRITGNGHVVADESPYGSVGGEPIYGGSMAGTPRRPRPSVPPPAPPAPLSPHSPHSPHSPLSPPALNTPTRSTLPPPPPPPEGAAPLLNGASPPHRTALDAHLDHMHAVIGMMSSEEADSAVVPAAPLPPVAPPSPPPPPPAAPGAPPAPGEDRPRPPSPGALLRGASALKPPRPTPDPQPDPRSDLLKAIRDGIKLRKVEKRDDTTGRYDTLRGAPVFLDVASILARRVAPERAGPEPAAAAPAPKPPALDDACYVRNSSFLSQDIEAQKAARRPAEVPPRKSSIPAVPPNSEVAPPTKESPPVRVTSPMKSPPKKNPPIKSPPTSSPLNKSPPIKSPPLKSPLIKSPPQKSPPITSPPVRSSPSAVFRSPPTSVVTSPPASVVTSAPASVVTSPPLKKTTPPRTDVISPPIADLKPSGLVSKTDDSSGTTRTPWRESPVIKEGHTHVEKLSLENEKVNLTDSKADVTTESVEGKCESKSEESNGVGDKIKKFEKAAEDANANVGRLSRPGSVRGRPRTERLGSDNSREDLPPPATPFKDNVHFDLGTATLPDRPATVLERQQSLTRIATAAASVRWQPASADVEKIRPEPQKIIKPEFKPMPPMPLDVTIRSPSLGAKISDQFPSHGTAFRNVASPDPARSRDLHKINDDVNTQNNFKTCKFKNKEKYSVSKGSSYYTRGSEEIWLVKKKDIEEIEERVLDSFRRAGGNICMRSESMRPSSDSGQTVSFSHATMGRTKRQMYARSESLDPQWAGARAQTLKRQSSVACTCGHDKKTRAKSAGAETTPRPRSRSHGDENNQAHVLDKYETLV